MKKKSNYELNDVNSNEFRNLYMNLWQGVCCRLSSNIMKATKASGHLPNGKIERLQKQKALHKAKWENCHARQFSRFFLFTNL